MFMLGIMLAMNGAVHNESWSWLLFACMVAVAVQFPPRGSSLANLRRWGRGSMALSRTAMALLALLPFVFYGLGLRFAEIALRKYEPNLVGGFFATPHARCASLMQEDGSASSMTFLGHVNEYDFFHSAGDVIVRRADAAQALRLTKCDR